MQAGLWILWVHLSFVQAISAPGDRYLLPSGCWRRITKGTRPLGSDQGKEGTDLFGFQESHRTSRGFKDSAFFVPGTKVSTKRHVWNKTGAARLLEDHSFPQVIDISS